MKLLSNRGEVVSGLFNRIHCSTEIVVQPLWSRFIPSNDVIEGGACTVSTGGCYDFKKDPAGTTGSKIFLLNFFSRLTVDLLPCSVWVGGDILRPLSRFTRGEHLMLLAANPTTQLNVTVDSQHSCFNLAATAQYTTAPSCTS